MSYFKTSLDASLLDLLGNKYWVRALSTSPLVQSMAYLVPQLKDIGYKIDQADMQLEKSGSYSRGVYLVEKIIQIEKVEAIFYIMQRMRKML